MAKRKTKSPSPNQKPPLFSLWVWQLLALAVGKSLGVVIVKVLGVVALWAGIPWP